MIENGANPNVECKRGTTALASALNSYQISRNPEDLEKFYFILERVESVDPVTKSPCMSALCNAASMGRSDIVKVLLEKGANPNLSLECGSTALHWVTTAEAAALLLDRGASIEARCNLGWTPLCYAATEGDLGIACLLLDHGAQLDVQTTNNGLTPLSTAALRGMTEMVMFLLKDRKANPEIASHVGFKAIHCASQEGHLETLQALLSSGLVSVNSVTPSGWTPLHVAAKYGHVELIQYLLDSGAIWNVKNLKGDTPMDLSKKANFFPAWMALRQYEKQLNQEEEDEDEAETRTKNKKKEKKTKKKKSPVTAKTKSRYSVLRHLKNAFSRKK